MNLRLPAFCATAILLAGCVGSATQSVRSFIPGQLAADQPVLAQINKDYSVGMLAIGPEADRYRNQSMGLGLVSHPEAERYINQQLERLKQASGISGLPGQAYLFADTVFGGKASPDGNIYIPYAMLQDLESTDELAALLAHELAHTIRNHNSSDLFVQAQKKALVGASLLANYKRGDSGITLASDEKLTENTFAALMVSDGFINPGWTRRQELEADRLGFDLLIAAGYNGDAMFALLDKSATTVGSFVNRLNQNHDGAEKRYDSLLSYADMHYPDAPTPALETRNWQAISKSQKTRQIWEGLTTVVEAREAASAGKLAEAEKLMRAAVNSHTNQQNFLRQSFYELRAVQGQKSSMQQNLALGLNGTYPSLALHVEQALQKGAADPATTRHLISTFDQYGRPPNFYQHVITMADASELNADALTLFAECTAKYLGEGVSCGDREAAAKSDFSYDSLMQQFKQ